MVIILFTWLNFSQWSSCIVLNLFVKLVTSYTKINFTNHQASYCIFIHPFPSDQTLSMCEKTRSTRAEILSVQKIYCKTDCRFGAEISSTNRDKLNYWPGHHIKPLKPGRMASLTFYKFIQYCYRQFSSITTNCNKIYGNTVNT